MAFTFGTVIPAMVTPFDNDGNVDYDAAAKLAKYLVDGGCDGIVVAGTTGESATLSDEEKIELLKTVKAAVDVPLTMGTGSNNTQHSIELSKKAEEAGADALLVVTPYYNKPSQAGVIEHFTQVAQSVKLPIMLYDIPGRTGIPLSYETIIELAKVPNIVAIKDAKGDMPLATRIMNETELEFFSGDDALTLPWMSIGAKGVVSVTAQLIPQEFRSMVDAASSNDFKAAQEINAKIEKTIRATMNCVPGAVAVKSFLKEDGVLPTATVRLPLLEANSAEREAMKKDLTQ
ncbi:MAG: 4-hydroxy-tetrahydrodipicolinate synthase [Micrococcaceae bacterium]